ncbi:hypothetical protein FPZ43_17370 [Mucilaginibacter pallidiroseus]|uniref:NACHT domain-containing protein n=1 Tax=Mucilaginibacter pallidiroseus TaxID=2599295 RepID=A0A563U1F9_9SPHI|nr:hypothetical protein [Mucilaginibacter pallidiroseus]TWR25240.1 hypothetical protein FPZ43_17370 [Mucilaginibacter pallidiroseus]
MTIFLPQYFELLKTKVLTIAGLTSVTPSDCKTISVLVFNKTKQSLSETTLKRVFGFAHSKFNPSLFTIDVMAKFCGYAGWDDFCENQGAATASKADSKTSGNNWSTLKLNADKITSFTLQALKNKSGIPYNLTIKREFANHHLDSFLSGGYTATALCAPAGYGKTLALCHWIEERMRGNAKNQNNDIILFFSSSALMNVFLSGRNISDWILGLLGYSADDDIASLFDITQRKSGNFFLVLDGLDEFAYKPDQFQLLLNQITDIFSLYRNTPWFKLVLTMRSVTWINNMYEFKYEEEKWFKGFIQDTENPAINVPLFSVGEIKELCYNINPNIQNFLAIELSNNFNHPLYFQFYYKEHKNNFSLNNIDHVCIYELISTFILNKVYLGHYSTDKLILLKMLTDLMDMQKGIYDVPKIKFNAAIKQYPNAYQELLSVGFIREFNYSTDLNYNTVIKFGNSNFLQYILTKALLTENDFVFDAKLIANINNTVKDDNKTFIIKWSVLYAFKTGQQSNFKYLINANLTPAEKSDLVMFMGDLLEKSRMQSTGVESIAQYFKHSSNDDLFNYFVGIELIGPDYKKVIETLLRFDLPDHKKIILHVLLACASFTQLDMASVNQCINALKAMPAKGFVKFALNPINCIETLADFLKTGVVKKDFFVEITKFYFKPSLYVTGSDNPRANEVLYLLAASSILICQKPLKILRFLRSLEKVYQAPDEQSTPYSFVIKVLKHGTYYLLNDGLNLYRMYKKILSLHERQEAQFTPYMKGLLLSVKVKMALFESDFDKVPSLYRKMIEINQTALDKLTLLFTGMSIIYTSGLNESNPAFYKQVVYDNNKSLREAGIRLDLSASPDVVIGA